MLAGEIEHTRYLRNPLDVLAQQLVAMCAVVPFLFLIEAVEQTTRQEVRTSTIRGTWRIVT